jgi:cytochrome c oxidase assembly protein subunit 15
MRHLGAGLAIPTFPYAAPDGGWWPAIASPLVHLNFTHTRIGALVVSLALGVLAVSVFRSQVGGTIRRALFWVLLFLAIQWALGILVVVWHRPLLPTTAHVVNGALLLSSTVWLSLRAWVGVSGDPARKGGGA